MLSPKLITFDVTGTLLLFRIPVLQKYAETALKFGIKVDSHQLNKNYTEAMTALSEAYPNYGKDTTGWESWWTKGVEKTFSGCIPSEENHKILEMAKELVDYHTTKEAFTVSPGAVDLLEYLRTNPVKLGIISNYDPRLHRILELIDLKQYFDFIITSYDIGYIKPDARIFEKALELGNCTQGQEALHVGDGIVNDYLGAKNAGLRAVLITSNEEDFNNSQVEKNEIFKDFYELKTYFQEMLLKS